MLKAPTKFNKPKLNLVRENNLLKNRYIVDEDINESNLASGVLSPASKNPASVNFKSISSILKNAGSLDHQEQALVVLLDNRTTWKYPVYNELARIQYMLGKYDECLDSINNARNLVNNSSSTENALNKSIILYNHSQFTSVICVQDKSKLVEARDSINSALALLGTNVYRDYEQDYTVHKAFILPFLEQFEESTNLYYKAFFINPKRFIEEYTTNNSGKELLFYAITKNMKDIIKEILDNNDELDVNVNMSDMGLSCLLHAVYNGSFEIVKDLLELGADPLYKGDNADKYPLTVAIMNGELEISKLLVEKIKQKTQSNQGIKDLLDQLDNYFDNLEDYEVIAEEFKALVRELNKFGRNESLDQKIVNVTDMMSNLKTSELDIEKTYAILSTVEPKNAVAIPCDFTSGQDSSDISKELELLGDTQE